MTEQAISIEETIRQRAQAWLEAIRRWDAAALEGLCWPFSPSGLNCWQSRRTSARIGPRTE